MEAMLYALAAKFLDKTELRKVTEKINMALLGQLLMEDGIGKGEMIKLISLVMKKMKKGLFPEETAELPEKARIASAGFMPQCRPIPGFLFHFLFHLLFHFTVITNRSRSSFTLYRYRSFSGWAYRTSQQLIPNRLAVSLVYMSMVISAGYPMS